MMVLADCIALEEPLPEGLLEYFSHMSEVCELRAVAFKDLQGASQAQDPAALHNNLFYFWLLHRQGFQALEAPLELAASVVARTEFICFVESHCRKLIDERYKLRESPFFDHGPFEESMRLIETYYKLDPELALLTKRAKL